MTLTQDDHQPDDNDQVAVHSLSHLRLKRGCTQTQVADAMGVTQARISDLERSDPTHVQGNTMHAYIRALGGTNTRITADFDGHIISLQIAEDLPN